MQHTYNLYYDKSSLQYGLNNKKGMLVVQEVISKYASTHRTASDCTLTTVLISQQTRIHF